MADKLPPQEIEELVWRDKYRFGDEESYEDTNARVVDAQVA